MHLEPANVITISWDISGGAKVNTAGHNNVVSIAFSQGSELCDDVSDKEQLRLCGDDVLVLGTANSDVLRC
jgi:hypothetical protein